MNKLVFLAFFVCLIAISSADVNERLYLMSDVCQVKIRNQVDAEMHASLVYMNMAAHFAKNSVARPGLEKFFKKQSDEEREHAFKFVEYLTRRGGELKTLSISMPEVYSWSSPLVALKAAIKLEHEVNAKIHALHQMAESTCKDPHLMDFLEGFMSEQIESIDQLNRYVTELGKMNDGTGEFLFDGKLKSEL